MAILAGVAGAASPRLPVILDTDIGTAIDDAFLDWYAQRIADSNPPTTHELATAVDGTQPAQAVIAQLIQAAGTTDDELERLRLLRQLEARPDLNPVLRGDLGKLLPVVDDWANGKSRAVVDTSRAAENGYLCRFITGRVRPAADGPVHPPELSPGSPLRPIWCFYRGRMLIWQVIQSSPLLSVKERRERYYGEGRRLLEEARRAFPENRVVRMYLGEPVRVLQTVAQPHMVGEEPPSPVAMARNTACCSRLAPPAEQWGRG